MFFLPSVAYPVARIALFLRIGEGKYHFDACRYATYISAADKGGTQVRIRCNRREHVGVGKGGRMVDRGAAFGGVKDAEDTHVGIESDA